MNQLPQPKALTPAEIFKRASYGDIILDVRSAAEFGAGHVPDSLNIGLGGQFASWAGSLIPLNSAIIIVAESEEKVGEAQVRLARVGLENINGFLAGGIYAWDQDGFEVAAVPQISVSELKDLIKKQTDLQVIDVRRPPEYQSGHAGKVARSSTKSPTGSVESDCGHLRRWLSFECGYEHLAAERLREPSECDRRYDCVD